MSTYNYTPGLGNAACYQVSGKPWATASISPVNGVIEITVSHCNQLGLGEKHWRQPSSCRIFRSWSSLGV